MAGSPRWSTTAAVISARMAVPSRRRCAISKLHELPSSIVRRTRARPASTSVDTRSIDMPRNSSRE
jgi:hypothetical protein